MFRILGSVSDSRRCFWILCFGILGSVLAFWEVFWILGSVLSLWATVNTKWEDIKTETSTWGDKCREWPRFARKLDLPETRVSIKLCKYSGTCQPAQGRIHSRKWVILSLYIFIEPAEVYADPDHSIAFGGNHHWCTASITPFQQSTVQLIFGFPIPWEGYFPWNR